MKVACLSVCPYLSVLSPTVASAYNVDIPNKGAICVFRAGESGITQRHTTQKDNFKLMK